MALFYYMQVYHGNEPLVTVMLEVAVIEGLNNEETK